MAADLPDQAVDPGGQAVSKLTDTALPNVVEHAPQEAQDRIDDAIEKVKNAGPTESPRPQLNVEKVNPLDSSDATDGTTNPSTSHKPGEGKISVRDLAEKVGLGKGDDKKSDDDSDSGATG